LNTISTESRLIKHSLGETQIDGTPTRIVTLDWTASQLLQLLGISPIADVDKEEMNKGIKPELIPPNSTDLGSMEKPDFDKITELEPDLIFAEKTYQTHLYDKLSAIAPTVVYSNHPPPLGSKYTHLQLLENNIKAISDTVAKHEQGVEIVDGLHQKYKDAKSKLQESGFNGTQFINGVFEPISGNPLDTVLLLCDPTFFSSQILAEMGLQNATTDKFRLGGWGVKKIDIKQLVELDSPEVHFFYIHHIGQDVPNDEWKDDIIFRNSEMFKNHHVHPLGPLFTFGGPRQMEDTIESVTKALIGK
jgi:ferric hydroxamate transport system substrate-binding protein